MPYYNRFDIVQAHYWWNADHHQGQFSPSYLRTCTIGRYYSPGMTENGPQGENAQAIYVALCSKEGCCKELSQ